MQRRSSIFFPGSQHPPGATASYLVSRAICPVLTMRERLQRREAHGCVERQKHHFLLIRRRILNYAYSSPWCAGESRIECIRRQI